MSIQNLNKNNIELTVDEQMLIERFIKQKDFLEKLILASENINNKINIVIKELREIDKELLKTGIEINDEQT